MRSPTNRRSISPQRFACFQREARLRADVAGRTARARPFELQDGADCAATFEREETPDTRAL
jgi:hypothetical protein